MPPIPAAARISTAKVAAGERRYDLIQMSLTGGGGGGGLGGLNEDYLHTVEAFGLYLGHLEPGGFLSLTRWAQVPPRDALKLVATVPLVEHTRVNQDDVTLTGSLSTAEGSAATSMERTLSPPGPCAHTA